MELDHCAVCFNEYNEETCVPKMSECGHSFCEKCLTSILQRQKSCPKCRATLSRSIEEYPINFDLMNISQSSKEKNRVDFQDPYSLESMKNELNRQKKILKELMAERDSITGSLGRNKDSVKSTNSSTQILLNCAKIMFEADKIADLVQDIEGCLEEANKYLNCSWYTYKVDLLSLKDFENCKQYLEKIVQRLRNGKRIYACKKIDDFEEWKYGEITFSEHENQLHIHCLSSGFDRGASLVMFKDVKDCISRRENILPFIEVGNQKLSFSLTEDSPIHALRCIKFCTGEKGHAMKGLDLDVFKFESENLNRCKIAIPTKEPSRGYEDALYQSKLCCEVKRGDVTLQCGFNYVLITKRSNDKNDVDNLVGKLHQNCQIDFNKISLDNKIINSGISLQL